MTLTELRGLLRSLRMYYGAPARARRLRRFYGQFVRAGDLCFDIGAHVGNRLRAMAQLGARVVALEPQPVFYDFLRLAYGRNPNVTLRQTAAGARPGGARMLVSGNAPTVSSLSPEWVAAMQTRDATFSWVRWEREIEVEVTTLDALISEFGQPRFCKIDVEGYESQALEGLSQPLACLSFEYLHSALELGEACIQRLERLGRYRYNLTVIEATDLLLPEWVGAADLTAALRDLPAGATSGDVYARLAE
ncbi:MAG: FkbM family methyltransferase [Chloroflexi bacterium]|nr:FkbM family methyltransferase [Chloroflexota bacterium]